jgi:putative tRNA adenosine deaminase-associated protein
VRRRRQGGGGTIGLAAVGDDFLVALRVLGGQVSVFLSDLTASVDWPLACQVLDYLDIPVPEEDEDLDQVLPAGDPSIFADLGIDEMSLGALDIFPDEALESIARGLEVGDGAEARPRRHARPVTSGYLSSFEPTTRLALGQAAGLPGWGRR